MTDRVSGVAAQPAGEDVQLTDPEFLVPLRRQMIKFATLQLKDPDLAEDAVQEALAGALKNQRSFGGRSALKTWVFGILKYKIADALRQRARTVTASSLGDDEDEGETFAALFDARGHWHLDAQPRGWHEPEGSLRETQFWRVFEACLEGLPERQARVFMMREFVGLDADEICNALALSRTNLNVMLHRARLRLRACLETHWFVEGVR
jgi:RNA polymerase sigma-70 factor (ECF subfamily)